MMTDAWIIELSESAYEGLNSYLIWYKNQQGKSYVYTHNHKIVCFGHKQSAMDTIIKLGFCYKNTELYDLERLNYWVVTGSRSQIQKAFIPTEIDCEFLIDFWNLFDDICNSCHSEFVSIITKYSRRCYNKLFYGLHLPVIIYYQIFIRK